MGSCTLSDEAIKPIDDQPIVQGVTVKAKHPDKQEYLDAIINQIKVRIRSVSLPEILLEPRLIFVLNRKRSKLLIVHAFYIQ